MSFSCTGTDNYNNMAVVAITACGLGVLCNVDKIQTGILPWNYSLLTLRHTSSGTCVAWGILLGQIFGGAGGEHILWEVRHGKGWEGYNTVLSPHERAGRVTTRSCRRIKPCLSS
jgi:hypothetical protein